jgi:hypothetical protein
MKIKLLFITTLIFLTFSGCDKPQTKFYEKGGKTYFVDKKGEVYIINGTSKIKIEDYVETYEEPFQKNKNFTHLIDWDKSTNLRFDMRFKYIDNVFYEITISDIGGNY